MKIVCLVGKNNLVKFALQWDILNFWKNNFDRILSSLSHVKEIIQFWILWNKTTYFFNIDNFKLSLIMGAMIQLERLSFQWDRDLILPVYSHMFMSISLCFTLIIIYIVKRWTLLPFLLKDWPPFSFVSLTAYPWLWSRYNKPRKQAQMCLSAATLSNS